ncbi:MAG: DUF115 domain-containing protein [Eubacteriaceae bacterium]|nr:DUF115 domain-containing protein [Eubacteriaceae bacterium]
MSFDRFYYALKRRITNIPSVIAWNSNVGYSKKNKKELRKYKNIHNGERCFILANGPSLNKVDFDLLKSEYTIGMNRIYLMKKVNGFMPNYLACIDEKCQLKQFYDEYNKLNIPCFFNWNQRGLFDKKNNQHFVKVKFSAGFSRDIVKSQTYNGASVTYTCIQLAYYMGFHEVYLIGKDHEYKCPVKAGKTSISDGAEKNHFIDGYYKKGQVWDSPTYEVEECAYKIARSFFEKEKKVIKDATIDGKLQIFEKVDFYSLFN